MPKFSAPFSGCRRGEIYPTAFAPGDECPDELVDAARATGVLAEEAKKEPVAKATSRKG